MPVFLSLCLNQSSNQVEESDKDKGKICIELSDDDGEEDPTHTLDQEAYDHYRSGEAIE